MQPIHRQHRGTELSQDTSCLQTTLMHRQLNSWEAWAPPPTPLHGPAFRASSNVEKSDLIRVHNNQGHPAPETLACHLTTAKAAPHVIQAAREYVCDACVESTQPRHQRPAKLHEPQEFNDTVGLDGFYCRGQAGFQAHVVHLIDESSCFNVGRRTESRHHENALQIVQEAWTPWAGYPKHVYLDPAGELRSRGLESTLQSWNTTCFITGEA